MIFRLHWQLVGSHVRCQLFAGQHDGALGKCGDLVMHEEEFSAYAFLHKTSMQFRPPLGNVVPFYVVEMDQEEVDEIWNTLDEVGCPGPQKSFANKIEKYVSNR